MILNVEQSGDQAIEFKGDWPDSIYFAVTLHSFSLDLVQIYFSGIAIKLDTGYGRPIFDYVPGRMISDYLGCVGNETNLAQCSSGNSVWYETDLDIQPPAISCEGRFITLIFCVHVGLKKKKKRKKIWSVNALAKVGLIHLRH